METSISSAIAKMAGLIWSDGEWHFADTTSPNRADQYGSDSKTSHLPDTNDSSASQTTNQTKKKNRKQRQRAQSRLTWGNVSQHSFTLTLGHSVVPSKGCYPLSLGSEIPELYSEQSVDEYISFRQAELIVRTQERGIVLSLSSHPTGAIRSSSSVPIPIPTSTPGSSAAPYVTLETRQYDYKRGVSNPLFSSLNEEERRLILATMGSHQPQGKSSCTPPRKDKCLNSDNKWSSTTSSASSGTTRGYNGTSAGTANFHATSPPKSRSNSITSASSSAIGEKSPTPGSSLASYCLPADETLSPHFIAELHKEIKVIQKSRDENVGCSCKPTKVDKLSVGKMKSELFALSSAAAAMHDSCSGALSREAIEAMPKPELIATLKELLRASALCLSDCECLVLGIPCSADACTCLRKAHIGDLHNEISTVTAPAPAPAPNTSGIPGTTGKGQICGNPSGRIVFDKDAVNAYRKKVLEASK